MKLSVVMSVFNGAPALGKTLDSIAAQTMREYELIAIDDGSTDDSPAILAERSRSDPRIRVLTQSNTGLTRALLRGCAEARGEFIARHDCGDESAPQRFERQMAAFRDDVVLVSCATRHIAPGGERLYDASGDGEEIRASLIHGGPRDIHGIPHHASAMFRRSAYVEAGGYREAFRYAQDLDLWIRMAPLGRIVVLPDVLYTARFEPRAISGARRAEQVRLTAIAVRLRDARSDADRARLLAEAAAIDGSKRAADTDDAPAFYFIASCLRRNGDSAWKTYARQALRANPFHLRTWSLLLRPF